ncbi:hypothetical protein SAMN04487910_2336 [Aquimarina amphilecti]|uniref:Uncharacterized protein n=1 Tax=Aquimarina amphilecti TaxID=1038014 RepID=A0A1H7PW92_AQUAM|nr:hypothetical protein [Aquimarina amphilecti]SEL39664.1 hypothetical protein SAMN04487910_2336 [Aquimarina amphilecti]
MIAQKIIQNKLPFIVLVTFLVGLHIFWEHYNGGVTTHHLLAREDLPGISNWWGLLSIPLLSWILISLSKWLHNKNPTTYGLSQITKGFIGGLVFGILISLLWEFRLENILQYAIWSPIILAFFIRIYLPGNLLGFILGLTYTFGGILPIAIGLVLITVSFLVWTIFRKGIPFVFQKINQKN